MEYLAYPKRTVKTHRKRLTMILYSKTKKQWTFIKNHAESQEDCRIGLPVEISRDRDFPGFWGKSRNRDSDRKTRDLRDEIFALTVSSFENFPDFSLNLTDISRDFGVNPGIETVVNNPGISRRDFESKSRKSFSNTGTGNPTVEWVLSSLNHEATDP